jgi:hypothetical protein
MRWCSSKSSSRLIRESNQAMFWGMEFHDGINSHSEIRNKVRHHSLTQERILMRYLLQQTSASNPLLHPHPFA